MMPAFTLTLALSLKGEGMICLPGFHPHPNLPPSRGKELAVSALVLGSRPRFHGGDVLSRE